MHFTNLLQVSYWFSVHTPPFSRVAFIIALAVLGIIFALAIVARVCARQYSPNPLISKGLMRLSKPLLFIGILGLLLLGFRQIGGAVLSARFWMLLILAIGAAWFAVAFFAIRRSYDSEYARLQQDKAYREYLPKRKK